MDIVYVVLLLIIVFICLIVHLLIVEKKQSELTKQLKIYERAIMDTNEEISDNETIILFLSDQIKNKLHLKRKL